MERRIVLRARSFICLFAIYLSMSDKKRISLTTESIKKQRRHSCSSENRLQKSTKNPPKMVPGGSLRVPGDFSGASQARSSAVFRQSEESKKHWKASGRLPGHPGRPPGTQGAPQNRRKIDFRWKKRLPEPFLCVFVLHFLHFFRVVMFWA